MNLLTSNGEKIHLPDRDELKKNIYRLGRELDFCRLEQDAAFLQASITSRGLIISYRDTSGFYCSEKDSLTPQTAFALFLQCSEDRDDWKGLIPFRALSGMESRNFLKDLQKTLKRENRRHRSEENGSFQKIF